jgi:adenosylcobinamide-GDP ribazoletransferase
MRPFFTALAFLSLIPSPRYDDFKGDELGRAMALFPLIGLILGVLLFGLNILLEPYLPAGLLNIILIATLVLLTGGIHLDGLMDTADGFGGGNNRAKVLQIMKDSRTGSFGVLAAILILMVKWETLNNISPASKGTALLVMPVMARWGQVILTYISPSARVDGFGRHVIKGLGIPSLAIAFLSALGIAVFLAGWPGLILIVFASIFSFLWSRLFVIRIGGITGDVIGALSEIIEVFALLFFIVWI